MKDKTQELAFEVCGTSWRKLQIPEHHYAAFTSVQLSKVDPEAINSERVVTLYSRISYEAHETDDIDEDHIEQVTEKIPIAKFMARKDPQPQNITQIFVRSMKPEFSMDGPGTITLKGMLRFDGLD